MRKVEDAHHQSCTILHSCLNIVNMMTNMKTYARLDIYSAICVLRQTTPSPVVPRPPFDVRVPAQASVMTIFHGSFPVKLH